jgi:hypothetical protein
MRLGLKMGLLAVITAVESRYAALAYTGGAAQQQAGA